ncbi:uncharacterized protein LOC121371698 isoform X2 [Gigantopelta aegis]|uniref:uncharacterized protein LOC121371698 isoform X2 n=1 Tax=Gigantopelta aegis TaxID=1735272 RepID=UPI001B88A5C2|nr:uncharacterized protein LOC121371698 isoform X2 [Gigantopelta aegis]
MPCFYVLITGRTSVYIDTAKSDDDPLPPELESIIEDVKWKKAKKKKSLDRSRYGKFIMNFEGGDGFGEVALLEEDAVRNATVIADEDSDLLVISRELFERSMKVKQEEYYEERRKFIQDSPLFAFWTTKFQRLLELSFVKEVHKYGSVIMKQGEPTKGLVFIFSGQAKIVVEPAKHEAQFPYLMKPHCPGQNNMKSRLHKQRSCAGLASDHIRVKRKEGYAAAEKRLKNKTVDLCCVEKNEVVGDIEVVLNLDTNIGTVVSTTDTEVFVLNTKNFERLVLKKNIKTLEKLRNGVLQKLIGRLRIPNARSVPLLAHLFSAANCLMLKSESPSHKTTTEEATDPKLKHLIELFLKDKVPLIDPFVPNSLYYRKKSAFKSKQLGVESKLFDYFKMYEVHGIVRQKLPRSMDKLRNNIEAERELLGEERVVLEEEVSPMEAFVRSVSSVCPRTMARSARSLPERPHTSDASIQITECDTVPSAFVSESQAEDILDDETITTLFHQLQDIQKSRSDQRLRAVYSGSVRSRLRGGARNSSFDNSIESDHNEDDVIDWETSDRNLRHLEERIKTFCEKIRTPNVRNKHRISEMRRFDIEDPQYLPIPGGAVYVHKKACTSVGMGGPVPHRHVRRFMLARPSTSYHMSHTASRLSNLSPLPNT